jgi:hypothetical protein
VERPQAAFSTELRVNEHLTGLAIQQLFNAA